MYAPELIERRVELAQNQVGFRLERHSPAEVAQFESDLERKYADAYASAWTSSAASQFPSREFQSSLRASLCNPDSPRLSAAEVRFMSNERHLSMCDASYWATRFGWIKNVRNDLQRFEFRAAQRVYMAIVAELESMGAAVEMLCNKARQLGLSTVTELLIAHRAMFYYGVNATIASYDQAKTGEMAKMLFLAYDMCPWWMRPSFTRRVESDRGMLAFGGQRSAVGFQHGRQTSGISQGTTPTLYHLSEVAYYPDPEALIEVGLYKAVHPSPKVFGVLESTAAGDTGWWSDKYWYYKRKWPNCRMLSLFLPWFLGRELYPNETWLRKSPVPEGWEPLAETRAMIARAKLYVASNPVLAKVLNESGRWELPREQAWWWEVGYREAQDAGKEKLFYQEYPTDDLESFQGSYESVFGRETITLADAGRVRDYRVYGIVGQSIEDAKEPCADDVDYDSPRVPVKFTSGKGDAYRWEFVPLTWRETWRDLHDIREAEIPNGLLMVFQEPEPGYDYSVGVDTSTGVGDESTVVAVSRRALDRGEPDIQVAEFRSNMVSHVEAYPYVMAISAYYSRYMRDTTRYREPLVTIEQVLAVGDTVYKDMLKMGYSRFFRMTRYDSRPKDMRKSKSRKTGWFSFSWSRPILTGNFVTAVQNGWYVVNSPWTIWEMQHWETHLTTTGKEKYQHSADSTDDGIFANAMAFFCPNDLASLTERTKRKYQGAETGGMLPQVDLDDYRGQRVSSRGTEVAKDWRRRLEDLR